MGGHSGEDEGEGLIMTLRKKKMKKKREKKKGRGGLEVSCRSVHMDGGQLYPGVIGKE